MLSSSGSDPSPGSCPARPPEAWQSDTCSILKIKDLPYNTISFYYIGLSNFILLNAILSNKVKYDLGSFVISDSLRHTSTSTNPNIPKSAPQFPTELHAFSLRRRCPFSSRPTSWQSFLTNKESTPKGRSLNLPPEGAYEDFQSFRSFSGVMARPGTTCTEEPGGVVV